MKRILVLGSGGAGKSTFARRLGQLLDLEVTHLDNFYWRPGWVKTPKDEWAEIVRELVNRDSWIIDGNYSGTLDLRLPKCDTIVFLDMPRRLCLWRIMKRCWLYRGAVRPDIAEGCVEKVDLEFLRWVWNYSQRARPRIVELIRQHANEKRMVWLRSNADVERFLSDPGR